MNVLFRQYELIRDARRVLLAHCATLPADAFTAPVAAFAGKSVRDLLVHVADVYRGWLGTVGLLQPRQQLQPGRYPEITAVRALFDGQVEPLVTVFADHFTNAREQALTRTLPDGGPPLTVTPMALLTHVMTHEFHHKGQIAAMTRLLGYPAPDTDVIRTGR